MSDSLSRKRVPKFYKKEKHPTSCVIVINKMDECPYAFRELLMQELLMSTMLNHMSSSVGFSSRGLKLETMLNFFLMVLLTSE